MTSSFVQLATTCMNRQHTDTFLFTICSRLLTCICIFYKLTCSLPYPRQISFNMTPFLTSVMARSAENCILVGAPFGLPRPIGHNNSSTKLAFVRHHAASFTQLPLWVLEVDWNAVSIPRGMIFPHSPILRIFHPHPLFSSSLWCHDH